MVLYAHIRACGQAALRHPTDWRKQARVDGHEFTVKKFCEQLESLKIFEMPADVKGISFRSLINYFIRPSKFSYNSPEHAVEQWTPYLCVLYQSFLLNLDYNRAIKKHDSKVLLDEKIELSKRFKKDSDLRRFYVGERNPEIELESLRSRMRDLQENLRSFSVAKDYGERQADANGFTPSCKS